MSGGRRYQSSHRSANSGGHHRSTSGSSSEHVPMQPRGRDRLGELRDAGIMRPVSVYQGSDVNLGTSASNSIGPGGVTAILNEIKDIERIVIGVNAEMEGLKRRQAEVLNALPENDSKRLTRALEEKASSTRMMANDARKRIAKVEGKISSMPPGTADRVMSVNQLTSLKKKYQNTIQTFHSLQVEYSNAQKSRMLREMKIVDPTVSIDDVERAIANGGDQVQIFAQAVRQTRTAEARNALDRVQTRHDAILQIEREAAAVAELFVDLNTLVASQNYTIAEVAQHVEDATNHIEIAGVEVEKAIVHRKKAIAMKWCLCVFFIVLITGLAIYLCIYFKLIDIGGLKSTNSGSSAPAKVQTDQSQ